MRQGETKTVTFQPALCSTDNQYKAGLWVRDSTAGIGTVTFVEPETGALGGLGHGICDIDTGEIMPLLTGSMVKANIEGVVPGRRGEPGELIGSFDNSVVYGSLQKNTAAGVYGRAECPSDFVGTPLEVASAGEIKEGPAQIISTVDENGPALYDIKMCIRDRGTGLIVLHDAVCKDAGGVRQIGGGANTAPPAQQERGDDAHTGNFRIVHSGEQDAVFPAVEGDGIKVDRDGGGVVRHRDGGNGGTAGELGAAVAADGLRGLAGQGETDILHLTAGEPEQGALGLDRLCVLRGAGEFAVLDVYKRQGRRRATRFQVGRAF